MEKIKGKKAIVGVIGLGYVGLPLIRELGAKVIYNDPHIPRTHKQRQHDLKMKSVPLTPSLLARQDVVLISTDHTSYDFDWIVQHSKLVIDTRNACAKVKKGRHKILKA